VVSRSQIAEDTKTNFIRGREPRLFFQVRQKRERRFGMMCN
jgi:hypothetical protein